MSTLCSGGEIPPYGSRSGWIPRKPEDFGDGGAFPEIHIAQYPLGMGKIVDLDGNSYQNTSIVPLLTDSKGNIRYDSIMQYGHSENHIVHSRPIDSFGRQYNDEELQRPDEEEEKRIAEMTKKALETKLLGKVNNANASRLSETPQTSSTPQFVKYTPANQNLKGGVTERIIRLAQKPVDPLEPPKFKTTRVVRGPPSPEVPVMHSPPRKPTKEERENWTIPPCISNWKNNKGLTIALDKRLAADGRGLQEHTISPNFAKFAEVMFVTEKKAREEVEHRANIQQTLALEEKKRKDKELLEYAQKARLERLGILSEAERKETLEERKKRMERERFLEDRRRDRERDSRQEKLKGRTKAK